MSMQGRAGWPWPPGRALRARVSVLYFANKYRLFYCAWPGCGSPCSCVLGRACVSGAATHGPCRRGDVHPSQVVGVPGGWVGAQAGGVGQGGGQECAGGDPVYFRGAAAIRTAGPLSVRGQGHVPGPVRGCDVAALPALAGWGASCPAPVRGRGQAAGTCLWFLCFASSLSIWETAPCASALPPCNPSNSRDHSLWGSRALCSGWARGRCFSATPACGFGHGCLAPACAEGLVRLPRVPWLSPSLAVELVTTPWRWLPAPAQVVLPAGSCPSHLWLCRWKCQGVKLISCGKHLPHHPAPLEP